MRPLGEPTTPATSFFSIFDAVAGAAPTEGFVPGFEPTESA